MPMHSYCTVHISVPVQYCCIVQYFIHNVGSIVVPNILRGSNESTRNIDDRVNCKTLPRIYLYVLVSTVPETARHKRSGPSLAPSLFTSVDAIIYAVHITHREKMSCVQLPTFCRLIPNRTVSSTRLSIAP